MLEFAVDDGGDKQFTGGIADDEKREARFSAYFSVELTMNLPTTGDKQSRRDAVTTKRKY